MEINLVTISKISSEIINREIMKIEHVDEPVLQDLTDNIYDRYPSLYRSGNYAMFWRYSKGIFLPIHDYITYLAAIRLMTNKTIYLLLNDIYEYWEDNTSFLLELDRMEMEEKAEKERDIYDVRISKKVSEEEVKSDILSVRDVSRCSDDEPVRDEDHLLSYALKAEPESECYTTDMVQMTNFIRDLKKGYPKMDAGLQLIPDVVFEKRIFKETKGKAAKKDKKNNKGSKKDKGGKKKGGKKK